MGGHFAVAGVDSQDQPLGKLPAYAAKPIGLPDGQRADHQAAKAQVQELANRLLVANAATQLTRQIDGIEDRGHDGQVPRLAFPGAVEIDEVQMAGPPISPLLGDGNSILAENRFAIVVALLEAHAFASAQIDCRPDFHPLQAPDQAPGPSYETMILHQRTAIARSAGSRTL